VTARELRFQINLLGDGLVVTADGEYLGTWDTDESDAIYQFTPDGASAPLLHHPSMKFLCDEIDDWHRSCRSGLSKT